MPMQEDLNLNQKPLRSDFLSGSSVGTRSEGSAAGLQKETSITLTDFGEPKKVGRKSTAEAYVISEWLWDDFTRLFENWRHVRSKSRRRKCQRGKTSTGTLS